MEKSLISLSIIVLLLTSCSSHQEMNKVVVDPDINKEILIGRVNEVGLNNNSIFADSNMYYKIYNVDNELAEKINKNDDDITVKVVFGSWCGDSRINVPAFQKIVDVSGFDKSQVEYIAVDRKKKAGKIDISGLKVKYVPTFIFYKEDKEIGRIVEYPSSGTIEQDWVNIIAKK